LVRCSLAFAVEDVLVKAVRVTSTLRELPLDVVRLAALTAAAITAATDALVDGDLAAAQRVIDDDDAVDTLRHTIEDGCLELLATGQLENVDLRFVAATLRVAHELERSADLMVNVAKSTWRLHPSPLDSTSQQIIWRMGRQAVVQLRVAVNAFADRDCSWASALADMDEAMDDLESSMFRHVLAAGQRDEHVVARAVQLGLVARHYERVGDHAVTIAEQVALVVTGERMPRRRRSRVSITH
jgi:phosphate transport system protein